MCIQIYTYSKKDVYMDTFVLYMCSIHVHIYMYMCRCIYMYMYMYLVKYA